MQTPEEELRKGMPLTREKMIRKTQQWNGYYSQQKKTIAGAELASAEPFFGR